MNITESEVRQALEALIAMQMGAAAHNCGLRICDEAIATLKEALARPSGVITAKITDESTAAEIIAFWRAGAQDEADDRLLQDEPGKDARKLSKHLAGKLDARNVIDQNFKETE